MKSEPLPKTTRDRPFSAVFALIITAVACSVLVLATPRAIVPRQLPALVLDPERVALAVAADEASMGKVSHDADVAELVARYRALGRAERAGPIEQREANELQFRLRELGSKVFARVGPEGRRALRADALQRFLRALSDPSLPQAEAEGELGNLPELLKNYGILDAEGGLVAPELCLRTSFKARWNLVFNLRITQDFSAIELQAFEGWIALHAAGAPTERRIQAARTFQMVGGHRSTLAHATWLSFAGSIPDARELMQKAYSLRPELATRNFELGLATQSH